MADISKLQRYSLGIVAANKPLKTWEIEVTPIEDLPMLDGELTDQVVDVTSKAEDADGAAYETRASASATVRATWLPMGCGNRYSAPDVRRGERVELYRFADEDRYWWVTQGQDAALRKLETIVWGISATSEEDVEPGPDNMYWLEISSHQKLITFQTSQANGEPFTYAMQLNTGEGTFSMQDSEGNELSLDSGEHIWEIRNADQSFLKIDKKEAFLHADDLIRFTSKRVETIAGQSIFEKAGQTIENDAGNKHTITAPNVEVNGETEINGDTKINGAMIFNGEVEMTQSMSVAMNIKGGPGGLDYLTHKHQELGDGQLTSIPTDNTGNIGGSSGGN